MAGTLILAFLARAPLYLAVFPPLEGWDEYQHLAYIAHLDEKGSIPLAVDTTRVPLALRPLMLALPHSLPGSEQLHEWGVLSYAEYWNTPSPSAGAARPALSSPRLYQAQHPPLAYVLAWPLWHAWKTARPLEAIYALRAINLLLVAAALTVFALALPRFVPNLAPRVAVLALVCLHPLFFQNAARVANDALAVATGLAGISLLVLTDARTLFRRGLLASGFVAASIYSKQTSLTLVPVLVLGIPFIGVMHGVAAGRRWRATALVLVALLVLMAPLWLWSYRHYGAIVTVQDSLELWGRGSVVAALRASATSMPWITVVQGLFVPGRAWVGGWTYLPMPESLTTLYTWSYDALLAGAVIGGVVAIRRRAVVAELVICGAVVGCMAAGMLYQALTSHAVFGRPMTNAWYFMTALPFLFVLLVRGLDVIHRALPTVAGALLAALFVVIDVHGTWVQMPVAYSSTTDVAVQWARLSSVHPAILSGRLRWWFLAIQLAALGVVIGVLLRLWHQRRRLTASGLARGVPSSGSRL